MLKLGPSTHGLVADIQVMYIHVLEMRCRGCAFETDLCKRLSYHILIISQHISDFSSKSNSSTYYLKDCTVISIENVSVFMNISKKPRYHLAIFGTFSRKSTEIDLKI